MITADLASYPPGSTIETDLVIVGGGPAGLTLARELAGRQKRVLVLESGQKGSQPRFAELNHIESVGEPRRAEQLAKRLVFHSEHMPGFRNEDQPYGVRRRELGGSSEAWAGKSTLFDETDFAKRDWIANSGWPIARETLEPYFERAARHLNLGPNIYDEQLWSELGVAAPEPRLDADRLRECFWQFARSTVDSMDVMRFSSEAASLTGENLTLLTNATATEIHLDEAGGRLEGLEISTIDGVRSRVRAGAAILAAGGIETPRLMLASRSRASAGVGNRNDTVGRYLMDHPGARIGMFPKEAWPAINRRFGFYSFRNNGQAHMYQYGLAPSAKVQKERGMLNCAAYVMGLRAPNDPLDALKRVLKGRSSNTLGDTWAFLSSPGFMAKGVAIKMFEKGIIPRPVKNGIINTMIHLNPNFVAEEFQNGRLPHKLTGLAVDAITEQIPDRDSRIVLSDKRTDALGMPVVIAEWRIHDEEMRTLAELGALLCEEMSRAGLPAPELDEWVREGRLDQAVAIDMAHTIGTTRMSSDPRDGVVDQNCKVHGVDGLYVAGSSVFPTSGHANPTLMLLTLAVRLADHLKDNGLA